MSEPEFSGLGVWNGFSKPWTVSDVSCAVLFLLFSLLSSFIFFPLEDFIILCSGASSSQEFFDLDGIGFLVHIKRRKTREMDEYIDSVLECNFVF